jgi:hypothetical protein
MKIWPVIAIGTCGVACMSAWAQEASAAPTTQSGTFTIVFAITIKSLLPTTTPILCNGSLAVFEVDSATGASIYTHNESASVVAVRTGSSAKCTITIPYSWLLSIPSSDRVSQTFEVSISSSSTTTGVTSRDSLIGLPPINVPANGATISETINVTF